MASRPIAPQPGMSRARPSSSGKQSSGGGIGKWIFIAFMIGAAYAGYSVFLTQEPVVKKKNVPAQAAVAAPATTWERTYNTTFNYGGQIIFISKVKVQNLNRTTADVTYTILTTPSGTKRKWISDRSIWKIGRASTTKQASRISTRQVDNRTASFPRFRVSTNQLERGSYLQINIPQYRKSGKLRQVIPVRLGLEIPSAHRGIEERNGQGGF